MRGEAVEAMLDEEAPGGLLMDPELEVIPHSAGRAMLALLLRLDDPELILEAELTVVTPPLVPHPVRPALEEPLPVPPQGPGGAPQPLRGLCRAEPCPVGAAE